MYQIQILHPSLRISRQHIKFVLAVCKKEKTEK